jgi:hypothetical protein
LAFLEFHGIFPGSLIRSRIGSAVEPAMIRDFGAKLRITAAALGCASQKDLCARFREANPGTTFELDRSYKWMQGRALPRSVRLYEDWAALLGTGRPLAWLQSCTVEEFLDLLCGHFAVSPDALVAQAGIVVGARSRPIALNPIDLSPARHLVGAYACYCHSWSPYSQGRIARASLVIEARAGGVPELEAIFSQQAAAFGHFQLRGPVVVVNRSAYLHVMDATACFRRSIWLFLPGPVARVLAGVMSGTTFVEVDSQPAATRIVMIRVPAAGAAMLEQSNRYLDAPAPAFSSDLMALGVPVAAPAELDALLEGFLAADRPSSYIKIAAAEYTRLGQEMNRLFIEDAAGAGVRPLPRRARRSARDTVRLVEG